MFWTGCGFGLPDVFPSEFRLIARKPLSSVATLFQKIIPFLDTAFNISSRLSIQGSAVDAEAKEFSWRCAKLVTTNTTNALTS
jgi:hypothetical protein